MKKFSFMLAILGLMVFSFGSLAQQNGYDLFQKALAKERAEGNLEEAIALYQKVIEESKDESLAAKAQLRIGICYEKLGRIEAQKAYEMVLKNYAGQKETAAEARRRLEFLLKPEDAEESGGLSVRRVWSGPQVMTWGSLSPNGRYLSFVENHDLFVRDLKTGKNRRLTKGGSIEKRVLAMSSTFSPDGSRIVYSWLNEDGIWDLRIIGIEETKPRILLRREGGDSIKPLGWSPDGKRVLAAFFLGDPPKVRNEIGFVSVPEGSVEIIKSSHEPSSYASFNGMRLSPDGRFVACAEPADDDAGKRDIFVQWADGSHRSPLIQHPANDQSPIWTLDGRHILFISDREGNPGVWMIDIKEGKGAGAPKLVKKNIGKFVRWIGITPEGASCYAIQTVKEDIYIADFTPLSSHILGKSEAVVSRFEGSNFGPAWSPDGDHLAFLRKSWDNEVSSESSAVIIRSMQTGEERTLPNKLNQPRMIHWFPDGKSLLVSAFRSLDDQDYCMDFYRVDIENGDTAIILQDEKATRTLRPGLSPDGKRIFYFCRNKPDETALVSYNLESGEKNVVYLPGHNPAMRLSISLSPDGHRMAFVDDNGATPPVFTVKVLEVGGGNSRDLLTAQWPELINGARALAWTEDARHLMIVKMTFGAGGIQVGSQQSLYKDELLMIPVEGGRIQKAELTVRVLDSLRLHPDGSKVAFSALSENPPYEIWVMENFLPDGKAEGRGGRR
jgi:Tol biopolymer transport system component